MPRRSWVDAKFTPIASARSRTMPGPGSGIGSSSIWSTCGGPYWW
ncbi:hypothetical protein [Kutzneria kofuensis]|uniref:Uncharacterized protein n=1 Tax=Kutzneria kofuensis TaxID=103725 RepID=A0A7W9NF79_9PSEU|nr:hypothetical protein [Kutzneria kofuensis]MBB5890244.1 hypothetical protein [Kutzneria kofuensis]